MKIFISYAHTMQPMIRELRLHLPRSLGPWIDEEQLRWADDLEKSLGSAIHDQADFVIVFIDRNALDSEWVQREIGWALAREKSIGRKFVLPVLIGAIGKALPTDHALAGVLSNRITILLNDLSSPSIKMLADQISFRLLELLVDAFDKQNSGSSRFGHPVDVFAGKLSSIKDLPPHWKGYIIQDSVAPNTPKIISAEMILNRVDGGHGGFLNYRIQNKIINRDFSLELTILSAVERAFVGNYVNRRPESTHFGTFLLQMDFEGDRLDGGYAGIGNIQQRLTRGRLLLSALKDDPKSVFSADLALYPDKPDVSE